MKKIKYEDKSDLKSGYDEKSPITGNYSVFVEETPDHGNFRLCMDTGYHTYDDCTVENTEVTNALEKIFPPYYVDYKFIDNKGRVWYPLLIANVYGMLHAYIIPDKEALGWAITSIELVDDLKDLDNHQIIKLPFNDQLALCKILPKPIMEFEDVNSFGEAYDEYLKYVNGKINEDRKWADLKWSENEKCIIYDEEE